MKIMSHDCTELVLNDSTVHNSGVNDIQSIPFNPTVQSFMRSILFY